MFLKKNKNVLFWLKAYTDLYKLLTLETPSIQAKYMSPYRMLYRKLCFLYLLYSMF